jgi:hypothetical protein
VLLQVEKERRRNHQPLIVLKGNMYDFCDHMDAADKGTGILRHLEVS